MTKRQIAPALRDAMQRCGGMEPKDGFYEFLERVNRTVRALEIEEASTAHRVLDSPFGKVELIVPDSAPVARIANAVYAVWTPAVSLRSGARLAVEFDRDPRHWRLALGRWLVSAAAAIAGGRSFGR